MKNAAATSPKSSRKEARITIWMLLPHPVRRLVIAFADMPDARANDELTAFTRIERARITAALRSMMIDLSMAESCMSDSDVTARTVLELH
ncbi:hypothetical protein BA896_023330 [Janthinobacterium lividum]|uniref:Uncharacterized protein n=1 Tax=Janthinobacterium lividum TaxID=29581 RepID=A0A1E8PMR9_9BURK|nr:hypothetical protein BA896_023330 [Janthinobacterium lividum]